MTKKTFLTKSSQGNDFLGKDNDSCTFVNEQNRILQDNFVEKMNRISVREGKKNAFLIV